MRRQSVERTTRETCLRVELEIDGRGRAEVECPIGFFRHMLETFARHAAVDLRLSLAGDLDVDQHHLVEDAGLALGDALRRALGEKRGIRRAGCFCFPMDEALAAAAVDLSGRPFVRLDAKFLGRRCGDFELALLDDFFAALAASLAAAIHLRILWGRSDHHKVEALFKALGRALRDAWSVDERAWDEIPSTKGVL